MASLRCLFAQLLRRFFYLQEEEEEESGQCHETKSRTMPYIPHHLVAEILPKLPVKSLIRLKVVSKSWLSLISSSEFTKSHLNQSIKTRILIVTNSPHDSLYTAKPGSSAHNKDMIAEKIDNIFEMRPGELVEIVDSCNGLVCIWFSSRLSYVIFNFSTRESKKIPACDSDRVSRSGFGYDDSSDDYKLVKLSRHGVYVYSLRIDFWKKVQDFGEYSFYAPSQGTVLNGVIYWVCLDKRRHNPSRIVAFDLMSEKLSEIGLPSAFFTNTNNHVDYAISVSRLEVFEGRLHLTLTPPHSNELWVMKIYGVVQSWTKYHIKNPFSLDLLKDDANVVFFNWDKFNLRNTKERADLLLHGIPIKPKFRAKPYVESLVSPIMRMPQQQ